MPKLLYSHAELINTPDLSESDSREKSESIEHKDVGDSKKSELIEKEIQEKRKKRLNKMFNTAYRTGDYEYVELPEVKVDTSIINSNFKLDTYEQMRSRELNEFIDELWCTSVWYNRAGVDEKMDKIPKKAYSEIFEYFYSHVKMKEFTIVEITVAVGEYLNIPLNAFYSQLSPLYQSKILEILHRETKILKHKKVFNLL